MAGLIEYDRSFTFTSTGASTWVPVTFAFEHGLTVETAAGSSATVHLEHRRKGSTIGIQLGGGALNLNASSATSMQVTGAFHELRVRVSDMTSTGTVHAQLKGVS